MTIHVAHATHAAAFARESACLHSQWQSFILILADALAPRTGETWTPGDFEDLAVGPHSATWTLSRPDGFVLKVSAHGKRGVATMDHHNDRRDLMADGVAAAPMLMRLPIHHFDRFDDPAKIAADLVAGVIEPSETYHHKIIEMREKRERLARQLTVASDEVATILDTPTIDPDDKSGRTHLVTKGHIFGRLRLGRCGSGTVELSGLSHSQIAEIARIVGGSRQGAV